MPWFQLFMTTLRSNIVAVSFLIISLGPVFSQTNSNILISNEILSAEISPLGAELQASGILTPTWNIFGKAIAPIGRLAHPSCFLSM